MKLAIGLVGLLWVGTARADGECGTFDRAKTMQLIEISEKMIKLSGEALQGKRTLDTYKGVPGDIRKNVEIVKCVEPTLSGADLATAKKFEATGPKWADEQDARLAAEEKGRADIVVPICDTVWTLESLRQALAQEKANPSGVVDLRKLHDTGAAIQQYEQVLAQQKPVYAAFRHHPFTGWQSEGACVTEAARRAAE